jgi:hypothetical protein
MSTKKITEAALDNADSIPGKVAIDKYDPTAFETCIKDFFKKHKTAELKRIESTARGSELYDLDIAIDLPEEENGKHAQEVRQTGSALVHELKQEFYNYLNKEGYFISSMSVRGVRTNGDVIETTISLILPNAPKIHREGVDKAERIQNLIQDVLLEATLNDKKKDI